MESKNNKNNNLPRQASRTAILALAIMLACVAVIAATIELSRLSEFPFFSQHRNTLISAELVIFVIALVEIVGRVLIIRFRSRGIESVGYSIREVLRGAVYIALAIGVVSILSANPALAISIGTISGVIIGFATQNLIGNVVAGMMLAIVRPVVIGDQITVAGSSGRIKEIALIYTILDTGDNWYYVPNLMMFSNAITRKKPTSDKGP
jgi:small-conductance mechanosensitive channel